jgi:hypothetical protein
MDSGNEGCGKGGMCKAKEKTRFTCLLEFLVLVIGADPQEVY